MDLLDIIDELVQPELKNALFKYAWNNFALNKGKTIIANKPDEELKSKMKISYDKMKEIFNDIELADTVQESKKLNSGKMQDFVNKINKDVLELIPDA